MPSISERLQALQPGEAIHIGHSFVVLNVAGVRIALDPATETGACAAPFSNLTLTARTQLRSYRSLVAPEGIPSAAELAQVVDVVLYSHIHTDHFNAAVLEKIMTANANLQVYWPQETPRVLFAPRQQLSRAGQRLLAWLDQFAWADHVPAGVREFCTSAPPRLRLANTHEMADGRTVLLSHSPRLELRAFEVRHPRPLLWVRSPLEAATPPVLGYEISYAERGVQKRILLIGETSTDPEVLYRIWQARQELVGLFVPVDEWLRLPGARWLYDVYCHASPRLLALAERLVGERTTVHGLHHGLWLYQLNAAELEWGRQALKQSSTHLATADEVTARLAESRAARHFGLQALQKLERLVETISGFSPSAPNKVRLNPLGQPFRFGREAV